jgi:hypothetical protein
METNKSSKRVEFLCERQFTFLDASGIKIGTFSLSKGIGFVGETVRKVNQNKITNTHKNILGLSFLYHDPKRVDVFILFVRVSGKNLLIQILIFDHLTPSWKNA